MEDCSLSCHRLLPGQKGRFQMRSFGFSLILLIAAACGAPTGSGDLGAPIADPGDDRVIAIGESTTLSGLLSCDPSQGGLNYAWSMLEKPDASVLELDATDKTAVQFGIIADAAGTYLFQLTVSNGTRSSIAEVVVVEASSNESRLTAVSTAPETEDRCGNSL